MSTSDILISAFLSKYGLPLISILGFLLLIIANFKKIKIKMFSEFLVDFESMYERIMREHKAELFSSIHDITSSDWKLKNEGLIRILEIGVRTGENLKYYPKNSHVLLADKNMHMESYFKKNVWKTAHIHIQSYLVCHSDNLKEVRTGSVDAVVATLVLCNAPDMKKVLKEIHRVLAPGGKYYFIEHVHETHGTSLRFLQSLLSVSRLWSTIFDGCKLNRDTAQCIDKYRFRDVSYKYVTVEDKRLPVLKYMRTHIIGVAIK